MASRLAPLANLRDRVPGLARLSERLFGLSAKRSLPRFRSDAFRPKAEARPIGHDRRDVVLFADTFNAHFEPENLRAAERVLAAGGYRVHHAFPPEGGRRLCCGRTYLAAGMVERARAEARRTRDALWPHLEAGTPIVGLEPSCVLTFRDELQALLPGAESERLAEGARLLEEFLAGEQAAGRLELPLREGARHRALVHGHCHQKAFGAMPAVEAALRLVPGLEVETIEAGCCGMAGAFGYQAEHVEMSFAMAELGLLPAVRAAPDDALIVAAGTSCRHQILDGCGREARHPARVLADAVDGRAAARAGE